MATKWRVFIGGNQKIALGVKVKKDGDLWIPEIVAISNASDYMRLDRVTKPRQSQVKIDGTKATLTVHYVTCVLPLTLEDRTASVGSTTLAEDQGLRAQINYVKRGDWYKITPR